jgi:hypothetical protein
MSEKLTLKLITLIALFGLSLVWFLLQDFGAQPSTLHLIKDGQGYQLREPKLSSRNSQILPDAVLPPDESASSASGDIPSVTFWVDPRCQGQVIGEQVKLISKPESLRQLLTAYPMPEMRLVLSQHYKDCIESGGSDKGTHPMVAMQLSMNARRILKRLWKMNCAYYYAERFDNKDLNARRERAVEWGRINGNTYAELTYLSTGTPEGRRPFTDDEAKALVAYIKDTAQTLVANLYEEKKQEFSAT